MTPAELSVADQAFAAECVKLIGSELAAAPHKFDVAYEKDTEPAGTRQFRAADGTLLRWMASYQDNIPTGDVGRLAFGDFCAKYIAPAAKEIARQMISVAEGCPGCMLVTGDLDLPRVTEMKAREVANGVSARLIGAYDINGDVMQLRVDVLLGVRAATVKAAPAPVSAEIVASVQ